MAVPARYGSAADTVGEDLRYEEGLVVTVLDDDGLDVGWRGVEREVLATAHLYFGGQSKARWPIWLQVWHLTLFVQSGLEGGLPDFLSGQL